MEFPESFVLGSEPPLNPPKLRSSASSGFVNKLASNDPAQLQALLTVWNQQHDQPGFDAVDLLEKMAVVLENSLNEFLSLDPDPLDDRHPVRTHPDASYGKALNMLFRNADFMHAITISYIVARDNIKLNVTAARLLLSCVPGVDSRAIFTEHDNVVYQLFANVENSESEELRAYSFGLLACALESQEMAEKYQDQNLRLIPLALKTLAELKAEMHPEKPEHHEAPSTSAGVNGSAPNGDDGPFANIDIAGNHTDAAEPSSTRSDLGLHGCPVRVKNSHPIATQPSTILSPPRKRRKIEDLTTESFDFNEDSAQSTSNWCNQMPLLLGKHQVYPLTTAMHQRLILQYLTQTGEYQDLLVRVFEGNALPLLMDYTDLRKTKDVRLTLDAIRYISSLLVHRRFATVFVQKGGVEALLKVPCGSLAAVAVSTCLYYIAYTEDVMETCLSHCPESTLDKLVEYALWCVEHSHENGMASACMFFTHCIKFRPILERFDRMDGPRIVLNYLSTLSLFVQFEGGTAVTLTDEQMQTSMHSIRNVSACFRSYLTAHIYLKLEQLRRHARTSLPLGYSCQIPAVILRNSSSLKPMDLDDDALQGAVWALACALRIDRVPPWKPAENLRAIDVNKYMFHIVHHALGFENIAATSRHDMIRQALQVMWMMVVLPSTQQDIIERLEMKDHSGCSVLTHLISHCEMPCQNDEITNLALNIMQVLACVPPMLETKTQLSTAQTPGKTPDRKPRPAYEENFEPLKKVWAAIRNANGIMCMINVIGSASGPTNDRLRLVACRTLQGLARDPEVCQMLSKLPFIRDNVLQSHYRGLLPSERRSAQARFFKEARKLIEVVTKRRLRDVKDMSHERIEKQGIVASTNISYSDQEVYQLLHSYFLTKGLSKTASQLFAEAGLPAGPPGSAPPPQFKAIPGLPSKIGMLSSTPNKPALCMESGTGSHFGSAVATPKASQTATPSASKDTFFATPMKQTPNRRGRPARAPEPAKTDITLDQVLTNYFRLQHAECRNPIATCPPFELFRPHSCPEPLEKDTLSTHITTRLWNRPLTLANDRTRHIRAYERFQHSRFRPLKTFVNEEMCTAAAFSIDDEHVVVGLYTGELQWLNAETGNQESNTHCHHSAVTHIVCSRDGSTLLTSSAFVRPYSSVWRLGETQEHMYDLAEEIHLEYGRRGSDKILGTSSAYETNEGIATIYDTESGTPIVKMWKQGEPQRYRRNLAHFAPDDRMVLHDGQLWDPRCATEPLHTFDLFGYVASGDFHPHGNEVIINAQVWDLRTYKLLRSIPALDQCKLTFSSTGNIFYAIKREEDREDSSFRDTYTSKFWSYDSILYEQIAEVDVRKPLLGFCLDHTDQRVAVVERTSRDEEGYRSLESSAVKFYEIGKLRIPEEDGEEEVDPEAVGSEYSSSAEESSDFDDEDEEEDEDEDEDDANDDADGSESGSGEGGSLSSGWELDENADAPMNSEAGSGTSDDSDEDEDDDVDDDMEDGQDFFDLDDSDEEYEEEPDSRGQGSSSIVLNPHLRRARRRDASERDG